MKPTSRLEYDQLVTGISGTTPVTENKSASPSAAPTVRINELGQSTWGYKPSKLCPDGRTCMSNVAWSRWDQRAAVGTGTGKTCATGGTGCTTATITVTYTSPVRECGGFRYTEWSFRFTGGQLLRDELNPQVCGLVVSGVGYAPAAIPSHPAPATGTCPRMLILKVNADTSCGFAWDVAQAVNLAARASGGKVPSSVTATSSVTHKTYTLSCAEQSDGIVACSTGTAMVLLQLQF